MYTQLLKKVTGAQRWTQYRDTQNMQLGALQGVYAHATIVYQQGAVYTVRKIYEIPGFFRPNLPARESLVSDIPAGEGNIANLFLQCRIEKHQNFLTKHRSFRRFNLIFSIFLLHLDSSLEGIHLT
jgi:hypothetical protein